MADTNSGVSKNTSYGVSGLDYSKTSSSKTDKGTKIIKAGQGMDKNSFLKILSAELSHQDPTKDVDSTAYVTQLAQFASMEQMNNLNATLTKNSNESLVGKGVTVKELDRDGNNYTGIVAAVDTDGNSTKIQLKVEDNGTFRYIPFDIGDIVSVVNVEDYSIPPLTTMNGNMAFLLASSFINQKVELSEKDDKGNAINGTVKGVFKDNGIIKVRLQLDSGEIKEYSYDKVAKVGDYTSTK
ncbi:MULTISPECIES: flagellar hook capping FlgD N-terminal domain-containing protein [Clostridium]|uniref:Basal-body rod modification protein FlgD n=1 Tax=Clostridium cibarium TaxID=2762247 RepID=A0ABR8PNV2_9CLOT|nr:MULTISPECIES: flagellar hook capping FlgD N-terminal domain-containing protein [Clostridium]MBD7909839.1 flagellar biosynthesis protein FlgD [Clostridium cibarium]